jgi:superfamily I DNA/RNA helicase/mRNA-degrading endonuclease YafQ of YafQ-DinJ toxin-antitoxin module
MPSNILVSDKFLKMLGSLTDQQKRQVDQKIELLAENPRHPSLKAHRLTAWKAQGFWECYINDGDRLIYRQAQGALELHAVGKHAIIDNFYAPTQNEPLQLYKPSHSPIPSHRAEPTQHPTHYPEQPTLGSGNPYRDLLPTHLRILGVPAALVSAVQKAEHIEDLEALPLPSYVLERLFELATNADLAALVFEQGRLLYRTTLDKLHGYIEGSIKRLMLNLTPEQERFLNPRDRTILLRGCAGSGKTTIAIYRAIQHAETGKPVLFITYTKTLAKAASTLIEELIGPLPGNLEVMHIDAWLSNFLAKRGKRLAFSNDDSRKALRAALATIQQLPEAAKLLNTIPEREREQFFRDEILTVIKAQGITSETEYLKTSRAGRGKALREAERHIVWQVYQAYRKESQPYADWEDLAIEAYAELQRQPLATPYAHVVVDEVQDLSPIKLRAILELVGKNKGERSLFFVGDVAQKIYSRSFTWKDIGLEMRGSNASSLRKNFRNTRQIAEAAAKLNTFNMQLTASGDFVDPEPIDRHGPRPILIECDTTEREQRAVREKILKLIEGQHFRLSDFAILAPTKDLCKAYKTALDLVGLRCAIHSDNNFNILEEQVKILTIHSAKGLEFPVVFVVGLHEGDLPRNPYNMPAEEHALHFERERTLLYVAMTRASEGLFLVTSQQNPSRFLREIEEMVHTEPFIGS